MRRLVAVLAASSLLTTSYVASGKAAPTAALTPLTERILVTENHRVAEFTVDVDPTDPRHLILGAIDFDDPAGGITCGIWTSRDGGRTWERGPVIEGMEAPRYRADPWVAFGPDGAAHATCLELRGWAGNNTVGLPTPPETGWPHPVRLLHARSVDGGATWTPAANVPANDPRNQRDKEALHVVRTEPHAGRVLICVNDYRRPDDDLWLYRSDDHGETWLPPIELNADLGIEHEFGNCNGIVEGPDGEIHVVYQARGSYGTVSSYDGGDTWAPPIDAGSLDFQSQTPGSAEYYMSAAKGLARDPGFARPAVAVNPVDGTLLVTVGDKTPGGLWYSRLHRSMDQGHTYQEINAPIPPIADCEADGCHVAFQHITFDGAGRLAFQATQSSNFGDVVSRRHWLWVSSDNGDTWSQSLLVGSVGGPHESWMNPLTYIPKDPGAVLQEFQYGAGHPENAGAWSSLMSVRTDPVGILAGHLRRNGDYWDIAATDEGFLAMWIDHKNGYPQVWARLVRAS